MINSFFDSDYARLGADLHAATYVSKLGGRFCIQGSEKWRGVEDSGTNSQTNVLPKERLNKYRVEALDLSKTVIQANGISNFGLHKFALSLFEYF